MRRFIYEESSRSIAHIPNFGIISSLLRYRNVYAYGAYPTPSKGDVGLLPQYASTLDWVNKYEKNIMYHASWRVHLYFLLLVAYHNQQCIIQIDSTELQHGMGIAPHLQACHSSLFPNLIDHNIKENFKNHQHTSIIDHSFLNDWNNMTVACPVISNRFDTFLEGRGSGSRLRKDLLFCLTACSLGSYEPFDALKMFFSLMAATLENRHKFIEKFDSDDEKRAAKRVLFLQQKGMFSLGSPVQYAPDRNVIENILQWDRQAESCASAYARTQKILLTGGKKEAEAFLKRFKF